MGSSRGPAWYPPPPKNDDELLPGYPPDVKPSRVALERGDGAIRVNGNWYMPIAPDYRPIEVRVFNVGIAIVRLAAVGTVTGAIVICIVSVLFHVFGLR